MNAKIKRWLGKSLLAVFLSLVMLAGAAVLVLVTQQQRLVNMAVTALNKQLTGELVIERSSISLFKNFPYVSVALHRVHLYADKTKSTRPLAQLDRLYAGFSLPDLLQQKYNIRRLSLRGGYLNLVRDTTGALNLEKAIAITSDTANTAPPDSGAFTVDIQKISIKAFRVSWTDSATGLQARAHIDKFSSTFQLDSARLRATWTSDMELDIMPRTDTVFFRHKKLAMDMSADYTFETSRLLLSRGTCKLQDATFGVEGSAILSEQKQVDFRIRGDRPDFNLMAAFLPENAKTLLKPFQYDGRVYFDASIQGNVTGGHSPLIQVSFGCEDAWFLNTDANRKVDQLGFKGYYTNGSERSLRTSELHVTQVNARPDKGIFKGNFVMRDFTDPRVLVQINSRLELKFLGEFLGIQDLKQITGAIRLDMDFKELTGVQLPEQSLRKLKEGIQSKLSIENLSFRIPGYPHPVRDMNLHAEMKDGHITLDSAFLRIANSDIRLDGSLSDIKAFLHDHTKTVRVALNARSHNLILKELVAHDTALSRRLTEEIHGFHIGLSLETSVQQLLHPAPLPKGNFELKNLSASFKKYPHAFQNLGATVRINDTTLVLRNFTGMIDKTDIAFSGRVINYQLWFQQVKTGKTQVAFDFKSNRFALSDILGPVSRNYVPEGYRHEEASNVWLRAKIDLRYDTVFRFAKAKIANISGLLKNHNVEMKNIHGGIRYGRNRVLLIDSLQGTIGRSDFDINLKLFAGKNKQMKKRTNSFQLKSRFLDIDQISRYSFAPEAAAGDSAAIAAAQPDTAQHAKAFNVFSIPFSDFNVDISIGKLKYNKLWLKDIAARLRMQEDHHLYVDTLAMKVADGSLRLKGHFNGSNPDKIYFRSTIDADQIDLEKIMLKLDHFGQDVVINKNIKGRLSGQIKSYVRVHPDLVPIAGNSKAKLNIRIYNGSLVDFAPMQAMAGYFKDKNLRLVRFDTLRNQLSFSDGVLDIPSMDINSSLGYIQVSGKQSLDLTMEYYVRVPMKMVTKVGLSALFGKSTEAVDAAQVDEITVLDKDKKVRFMNLKVTGKPEDFKVSLGKDKDSNKKGG